MKLRLIALFFALSLLFSLAACKPKTQPDAGSSTDTTQDSTPTPVKTDVRVYTLNGTTGFGMAKLMEDAKNNAFSTENYSF